MFGVNLRYRQAFFAAMIGSGLASAFIAFFNVKAIALGAAGFLGIPSIKPDSLAMYSIGMLISFVVAFTLSVVFVKRAQSKSIIEIKKKKHEFNLVLFVGKMAIKMTALSVRISLLGNLANRCSRCLDCFAIHQRCSRAIRSTWLPSIGS
ncbi:MAG: hypothetical protein ACLR5N_05395 [Haemophilus parainfluenzae]